MKLVKKIDLKGCGTGRQVRFGHLLGNGEYQMVLAQCQKRVNRDAYGTISCLTAMDLDGNILWQYGEPTDNMEIGNISADMPMQIYDIDGDGYDEVITAKNFEVLILDGKTGNVKKRAKTPLSTMEEDGTIIGVPDGEYAFDRINPDGMRICNFRGLDKPRDILIKDRYCRVYALNDDLEVMWHFQSDKNTGHFPFAIDINGDGYDELLVAMSSLFSGSFEPTVRYSAVSFIYQFSGIFASGLTPMIATMLVSSNDGHAEAFEKRSSAFFANGITFNKFTGSRGKSGSNDANGEYIAALRRTMDEAQVAYQFAELGRVDLGGGGTIAYIMANYGMEVIDSGVAVLNMHAPYEVSSKADVYEAVKGYRAFLRME